MFSYFGSKSKVIHLYPKPKYKKIIEPFAGSARYSLRYFDNDVLLVDKYEAVIKIWKYLQQASPSDIMALPEPAKGVKLDDIKSLSSDERLLMGFITWRGAHHPQNLVFEDARIHETKLLISKQLHKIKHWKIIQGSYEDIENQEATWFIDPPYEGNNKDYEHWQIDYAHLSKYCETRLGQVIACDSTKATWLPFYPLRINKGSNSGNVIEEGIWSNLPHDFQARQDTLF
jgi:hypothetical protein